MRYLADESVDRSVVLALRAAGQDVVYVAEMSPGVTDSEVLETAVREERILITGDKDFGDLVFRQRYANKGIILLRLEGLTPSQKDEIVSLALQRYESEFQNRFVVVTPTTVRIRRIL